MNRHSAAVLGSALALALTGCSTGGQAPGDPVGRDAFWSLVSKAIATGGADVADRADALTQELHGDDEQQLEAFQQHLAAASTALYTRAFAAALTLVCGTVDDDAVVAADSWVVAQGEKEYDAVLADPDALADLEDVKDVCDGSGEAFGDAAVARYSDLGYEPGSNPFPLVDQDGPPTGKTGSYPKLRKRFPPSR